jgi:molybdopterin-guanine dinucleotide biosynthesis protein A
VALPEGFLNGIPVRLGFASLRAGSRLRCALLGMTNMNISVVVLAGGESRRMGEDKATLLFRGKPLWQIQLDLLRKLRPAEILISARIDPAWRPSDVKFVPDDPPSRGPLSGLAASLAQIHTKHLLALAIDMPFMNEQHLRFLCDPIELGCGVLPMIGTRAEPLAGIYPVATHADFISALSGTDFSMQTLTNQLVKIGKLRAVQISKKDESFYRNLNERADFDHNLSC